MKKLEYTRLAKGNRITFSLSNYVHDHLIDLSIKQGRSVSNLVAFIVETYIQNHVTQNKNTH